MIEQDANKHLEHTRQCLASEMLLASSCSKCYLARIQHNLALYTDDHAYVAIIILFSCVNVLYLLSYDHDW